LGTAGVQRPGSFRGTASGRQKRDVDGKGDGAAILDGSESPAGNEWWGFQDEGLYKRSHPIQNDVSGIVDTSPWGGGCFGGRGDA